MAASGLLAGNMSLLRASGVSCSARRTAAATKPVAMARPAMGPIRSTICPGVSSLKTMRAAPRLPARQQMKTEARASNPDDPSVEVNNVNANPPNLFWKCLAALLYIVPWIDTIGLGREIYHNFPYLVSCYFLPGPAVQLYFGSQFAPLLVFFLIFLAVVKNAKLHHFIRFNAMQSIMLDIVVMLFTILRVYFPAEIRWSWLGVWFDMFSWVACMGTILYCVFFTLRGKYADVPYVSEAVYIQVEQSDLA